MASNKPCVVFLKQLWNNKLEENTKNLLRNIKKLEVFIEEKSLHWRQNVWTAFTATLPSQPLCLYSMYCVELIELEVSLCCIQAWNYCNRKRSRQLHEHTIGIESKLITTRAASAILNANRLLYFYSTAMLCNSLELEAFNSSVLLNDWMPTRGICTISWIGWLLTAFTSRLEYFGPNEKNVVYYRCHTLGVWPIMLHSLCKWFI